MISVKNQGKLSGSEQGHDGREQDESVFFQQPLLNQPGRNIQPQVSQQVRPCVSQFIHALPFWIDFLFDLENFLYFSLRSELQSLCLVPVDLTNDKRQKGFFLKGETLSNHMDRVDI